MFPSLLLAPEPGLLQGGAAVGWMEPVPLERLCLGAPRVQERVGFASSLSFKLGKLLFAVSRVTAGEMGS